MAISLSIGLLILRLVAGLTIATHGSQKLFGWFGGMGLAGTLKAQERMGFRPTWLWAGLVIVGELGGGLSLAFGLITPLGAAGLVGAMFMVIVKVLWKKGFFNSKGGYEFPLQLLASGVILGLTGPGAYSLDALFGIHYASPLFFFIVTCLALLVDVVGIVISRQPASRPTEASSSAS